MSRVRERTAEGGGTRQAAWLFIVAGLIGLANDVVPGAIGHGRILVVVLDTVNIGIGIVSRFAPWGRWRPRTVVVLPLLALSIMSIDIALGLVPESIQGVWLVLVFVWIGQWQPPRTAIALGPFAALACALPFAVGTPISSQAVAAIAIAVPVAVLVGETIARKETATRRAQDGQSEALAVLAAANLTDDLTGVGNRRFANVVLDELGDGDALAILDLDHFKRINDDLGHQAGDEVLRDLGHYLRNAVRGRDRVARYGGEEFIIVLRDPSTSAPATIARVLTGWQATRPLTTLSAGLATHRSSQPPGATFANADGALYDAKQAGRDQLVVHQTGDYVDGGDGRSAPTPTSGRSR
jgi:diguanylate cyclase (GGDEF)-like protein